MTGRPKGVKIIFRLLTVHHELIIYSIDSNGKTLIRHSHTVWHTGAASFCINTTWGKLSSECGASCLLNVGQVCCGEFSLGRVVLGRVVFGASCPVSDFGMVNCISHMHPKLIKLIGCVTGVIEILC